jgi:hypothetical protein
VSVFLAIHGARKGLLLLSLLLLLSVLSLGCVSDMDVDLI